MITTLEKRNAHLQISLPFRLQASQLQSHPSCMQIISGQKVSPAPNQHTYPSNHSGSLSKSPFADFPQEIVRIIVGHAADMCLQTTLTLTLVSKTVREWVEPTLYRTIILWTPHTVELFRVAFNAKPPSFFATHVRHLFINGEDGTDIISACSNVQRLAAYPPALVGLPDLDPEDEDISGPSSASLTSEPSCPTPVEIMLMGALDDVPWASPLFRNTKYLYIGLEAPSPETACDLSLLPSLTHCAFPYDGDADGALLLTLSTLLESTTLERVLVLVNDEEGNPDEERKGCIWAKLAYITDRRLLVGTEPIFDGEDWLDMIDEEITFWEACEELRDWRDGLLC